MKEIHKTVFLRFFVKSRNFKRELQKKLSKIFVAEYTTFTVISVVIGILVGLGATLFHDAIEYFNKIFFSKSTEGFFFLGAAIVILIPAAGMLAQALMIISAPKTAKHKGIPDVIKSVALRGGFIPLRTTLFHVIAPIICISTGGTVGPEGPAAQLGGGIGMGWKIYLARLGRGLQ